MFTALHSNFLYGQLNREVVGLVYHRVGDSKYPSTNVSVEEFEAHLQYLKQQNFRVLTMSDAIKYLNDPGERQKAVVITIDDGYESFFQNGLPLLKKYGFPATLFINTETVGGNSYMDWAQLMKCVEAGIEIGNHSHSHAYFLNEEPPLRYSLFKEDVQLAQNMIEEKLKLRPSIFAYPYGEFDPDMADVVEEMGFVAALAQNSGVMHAASKPFSLPRFPMATGLSAIGRFITKVNMHALRMLEEHPASFVLPAGKEAPTLEVTFAQENLLLPDLRCFVQGGKCIMEKSTSNGLVKVSVKAESVLASRRTLYTLTIKDGNNKWHWFSHLWVDVSIK